jgi:hypothetical protein
MKNWLRQQLLNFLVDASEEPQSQPRPCPARLSKGLRMSLNECDDIDGPEGVELPDPIHFKVQQVNGGTLIETRWYDYKKDEQRVKLHIVTPEENLSESIGKIVTMELLQK